MWTGNPSISEITRRIHQIWTASGYQPSELPARATVGYCFRPGRSRPNPDLLIAIVTALMGNDPAAVNTWRQALRVVMGEADAARYVSVSHRLPEMAEMAEFIGRDDVLDQAMRMVAGGRVCVITGMAGIGKTALVVHLGHRILAEHVADRTLFVNLRGFDPHRRAVDPTAVLESALRLLGVPGARIPHSLDKRVDAYRRALAATTPTLVLLDNAAGPEQLAPLLPGVSSCPVLVTSRAAFDLSGAHRIALAALRPGDSLTLLRRSDSPGRIDADRHTSARIAHLLGHLPLALSIIGGHLNEHPDWPLGDYPPVLTALAMEGGVRAALQLSDGGLPDPARRLLRLLALQPGPDIDVPAAAALAGQDAEHTADQLATLTAAHLLTEHVPGRYVFHDLIQAYAAECARLDYPRTHTDQALSRLFDYYADTAAAPPSDDWLDTELHNLLAIAPGSGPEHTVRLSAALHRHLYARARYNDAADLHRSALAAARMIGDTVGEQHVRADLGDIHTTQGWYWQATTCYRGALRLARGSGDRAGEQNALRGLGDVHLGRGRYDQAARYYMQAQTLALAIGDPLGEIYALRGLGGTHRAVRQDDLAATCYGQMLRIARKIGNRHAELRAWRGFGNLRLQQGRYRRALACYRRELALAWETADRADELYALIGIGSCEYGMDATGQAITHYRRALAIARWAGDRNGQFEAHDGLGRAHLANARPTRSLAHARTALDIATELGHPLDRARAHDGLAGAFRALGRNDQARYHWASALRLLTAHGSHRTENPTVTAAAIRDRMSELYAHTAAAIPR